MASAKTTEGYLLLADICGYTAFLTGTELEHAQGIIRDLTSAILSRLVPPFELVKLEGDAVFCHAPDSRFEVGEHVLEAIEACYVEFRDFLDDMQRGTACRCAACGKIDTLDLKFVAHRGPYLIDQIGGVTDLAGPEVIVAHRLLKNEITAKTGLRAYAFISDACRERLPAGVEMLAHSESYESLGEVRGGVHDMARVLEARRNARRVVVERADADMEFTYELPAPPPLAWQYFVDPDKRLRYEKGVQKLDPRYNENCRTGVGASLHCHHGSWESMVRTLDWRPYRYFTQRMQPFKGRLAAPPPLTLTFEFEERPQGCAVHMRMRIEGSRLSKLKGKLILPMFKRELRDEAERLRALLSSEFPAAPQPEAEPLAAAAT
jgi:hypothetical protein